MASKSPEQQTQTVPHQTSELTDPPESIIAFTPESLQLRWSQSRWQLMAGDVLLKDFGRQEALARRTLLLLRELRINQYGTVGQPKPVLEYWLTDGLAPQGNPTALRAGPLDQGSLRLTSCTASGACTTCTRCCSSSATTRTALARPWPS